jgi:predicted dehydrogenase
MAKKYSYLVIGAGSIGQRHIRNLLKLGRRVAVCEKSLVIRNKIKNLFPEIKVYSDLSQGLASAPDIAMICTPSNAHLQPALEAAKAGCNLFIEKPLAHNLIGVNDLLRLVERSKIFTLVGCNMRFQYGIMRLKELSRKLGKIYYIRCQFGQYLPDWRKGIDYKKTYSARKSLGGGIVLDAIHELDYLLDLMAKKPKKVSGMLQNSGLLDINSEDNASISVMFADNSLGEVHVDYLSRSYVRRCEIAGSKGLLSWDESEKALKIYNSQTRVFKHEQEPRNYDFNQSYIEELLHLERCISASKETVNPVKMAAKVLRLALAAKESAACSRQLRIGWF